MAGASAPLKLFGRDLSIAFVGHAFAKSLGIATFLLITNTLSVADFGRFTLAMSVFEIALFLSEFGMDTGVARFVSKGLRSGDHDSVEKVLKAAFMVKGGASLVVLSVGLLLAPAISEHVLDRGDEMVPFLRIAFAGVIGGHLQNFYLAYFGARLEFTRNAAFSALSPFAILIAVVGLWVFGWLDVIHCLVVYAFAPAIVCGFGLMALPHAFLNRTDVSWRSLLGVWRFSRWIYATNVLASTRFRLNSILLSNLAFMTDVGLYNYADRLAATVTLFTSTILTVFVPRASALVAHEELRSLLRRTYRFMAALVPLLVIVPFTARPVISVIGPEYVDAAPIFAILFASVIFSLFALPARTVLYSINRPQVETAIEVGALLLTLSMSLSLIETHGGRGAAIAMLVQRIVSSAATLGWVYWKVYRDPDHAGMAHAPID